MKPNGTIIFLEKEESKYSATSNVLTALGRETLIHSHCSSRKSQSYTLKRQITSAENLGEKHLGVLRKTSIQRGCQIIFKSKSGGSIL